MQGLATAAARGGGGGGGGGGGAYPAGRGRPAVAAKAGSPVRSADVAPGMELTDIRSPPAAPLAARQAVSALIASSMTAAPSPPPTARMTYRGPAWQAVTAAPAGMAREPAWPPMVMVMDSADRVRDAPEEPGTDRVSPGLERE